MSDTRLQTVTDGRHSLLECEIIDNAPLAKLLQAITMLNEAAVQLGGVDYSNKSLTSQNSSSHSLGKPSQNSHELLKKSESRKNARNLRVPFEFPSEGVVSSSMISAVQRGSGIESGSDRGSGLHRGSCSSIDSYLRNSGTASNRRGSGTGSVSVFSAATTGQPKLLPRWLSVDEGFVHESYLRAMEQSAASWQESVRPIRKGGNEHLHPGAHKECFQGLRWAIKPQSKQRIAWDIFNVMFIIWDLLWVPLHTFDLRGVNQLLNITDLGVTVFWTFDVLMSLRTGYYKKQTVELRPKEIAIRYARKWMTLDLILISFEWFACLSQSSIGFTRVVARCVRGVRFLKLIKFSNQFKQGARSFYWLLAFSILKYIVSFMVASHYLACGWHAAGSIAADGWVYRVPVEGDGFTKFFYLYITTSRWTLGQMNGETDLQEERNMEERLYTVFCAFVTIVFRTLFVSALTTRMVELLGIRAEVQKGMRLLNAYVHRHKLSRSTIYFAKRYVSNHQTMSNEADTEAELLDLLPDHLQWDLLSEVRSPTIIRHPFMKDLDRSFKSAFRHMLATTISNVYTRVLEVVFEPAMPCNRALFHKEGQLRYELEHNYKIAIRTHAEDDGTALRLSRKAMRLSLFRSTAETALEFGEEVPISACLSEAAFWIEWHHKGALVAVAESHLFAMDVDKFYSCLHYHVDAEARGAVYAFSFLLKMRSGAEVLDLMERDFGELHEDDDRSRPSTRTEKSEEPGVASLQLGIKGSSDAYGKKASITSSFVDFVQCEKFQLGRHESIETHVDDEVCEESCVATSSTNGPCSAIFDQDEEGAEVMKRPSSASWSPVAGRQDVQSTPQDTQPDDDIPQLQSI